MKVMIEGEIKNSGGTTYSLFVAGLFIIEWYPVGDWWVVSQGSPVPTPPLADEPSARRWVLEQLGAKEVGDA